MRRNTDAPFDPVVRDVLPVDRFCPACSANIRGARVYSESHYEMQVAHCPSCGRVVEARDTPRMARSEQRWQGLLVAAWLILLMAFWLGTNAMMAGVTAGVLDQASRPLSSFVRGAYQSTTGDEGRAFDSGVKVMSAADAPTATPPPPAAPTATGGSITTYSIGPGRVMVLTQQDDQLRQRFATWWAVQDGGALFAKAGGVTSAVPWGALAPWLWAGLAPLACGVVWPLLLPRVHGARLVPAWIVIGSWLPPTLVLMAVAFRFIDDSPSHVATAMVAPSVLAVSGAYLLIALLLGMLVGRPLLCGLVRLILPPRGAAVLGARRASRADLMSHVSRDGATGP